MRIKIYPMADGEGYSKDDACEKCDCEDGMIQTNWHRGKFLLIPVSAECPCPCHLTDQELYELDQCAMLHEKQQEGDRK